ncbi:MAG: hypothetical protein AAF587_16145 [Bacteroidota bacterium]
MKSFPILLYLCAIGFLSSVFAQDSMIEIERELKGYAVDILNHPSLEHKKKQNKAFTKLLMETLERPESYAYGFDSLETVSILTAQDNSFRVFTWQIINKPTEDAYYSEQSHYYFGLIQRRYQEETTGNTEYIIIPLVEMDEIPPGVENMVLDNYNWIGGLYYQMKYSKNIPALPFKYYDPKKMDSKGRVKKEKQTFYVMTGWNGLDNRSNLKFVDVMSFDPNKKDRVIFGANVFYFDLIPKFRALFKYSEYAPFSLNQAYVKKSKLSKKKMIVYDHLASPKPGDRKLTEIWEMGPDGSYDALYYNKKGGFFEWYTNVELAEDYNSKLTQKQLQEERAKEQQRLKEAGIDLSESGEKNK